MGVIFRFDGALAPASFDVFKIGTGGDVIFDGLAVEGAPIALRGVVENETMSESVHPKLMMLFTSVRIVFNSLSSDRRH